ncbi:type II secretion system protein GspL [Psychrobacter pygoscelis]|uniref:type II secretion system protein GspL n=1 Tax=Psychrobacter pygoscelis TaxID=2488563 RepID=UPI00103D5C0A|nr:type II secretion system protein GspL [Psychrobacter pygoscelis]
MLQVWLRRQHSPLLVWDSALKTWQSHLDWLQLRDALGEQSVCLYFPSWHIQQLSSELSSAQLKQLGVTGKQYLFEETSLTPADQLSIRELNSALGNQLFAVSQNDIDAWQQSALLGGFTISALLPDFLLLPVPTEGAGQQLSLYQDSQTTLVRQSETQGMAASYLPLLIERLPHLSEINVLAVADTGTDAESSLTTKATIDNLTDPHREIDDSNLSQVTIPEGDLDSTQLSLNKAVTSKDTLQTQIAENQGAQDIVITQLMTPPMPISAPERHALNFFVKPANFNLSPYLKVTIMVALAALVFQLSADALQWYRFNQATAATKLATTAQYDAWFPNEPLSPTNDLQVQLQPKLTSAGTAGSEHLALLLRISPLIKQSSLAAQSLVIEPTMLSFTIVGDNRDSLDKFANSLTAQGIDASLGSVNNSDQDKVAGQVTINLTSTTDS